MKTYNQLTDEQRCQIYALNKTGLSQNKIGSNSASTNQPINQSTISRELSRNTGQHGYHIKRSQKSA